jgi:AraC-like DNA-binding protein
MDSGRVVVAGNWYHDDGIELFEDKAGTLADYKGKRLFTYLKDVSVQRAYPFIFRTSKDDALIFGGVSVKGDSLWSTTAYTLKGDSVIIPLLADWWPLSCDMCRSSESFFGDADKGLYAYLLAVENRDGQVALAKVVNGEFSLLPTACPVPMHSQGEEICYASSMIVDQKARRGYLLGFSRGYFKAPEKAWRWYVLSVDYTVQPAALTLYYTDPVADFNVYPPTLTREGNLMIAGGLYHGSNFTPSKRVLLLRVGQEAAVAQGESNFWLMALLILVALLVVCACAYLIIIKRRRRLFGNAESSEPSISAGASVLLMQRIDQLMETQKLYQNSDLKVTDLATALGTNRRAVSDCINSQKGCTFTQFVNQYRIDHAKRVLRQNPDKKIVDIYLESGFANEGSFFRTFKAVTGMTPKEWLAKS